MQNLDFDSEGLQKLRRAVRSLQEAGSGLNQSEQDMVLALDRLASLNAANSLANDADPEISKSQSNRAKNVAFDADWLTVFYRSV